MISRWINFRPLMWIILSPLLTIATNDSGEILVGDAKTGERLQEMAKLGGALVNSETGEKIELKERKIVVLSSEQTAAFFLSLGNFREFAPDTESTDRKIDNASILHPLPPKFKAEQKEREPESSKLTEEQMIFNLNHNPNTDPRVKKNTEHSIASKRAAEEEIEEMEENRQTLEYQRMEEDIRHQEEGVE